ncbi:MAG: carboxypeptidase M32 [bacterium]|nr:carboxypeptidase M32 [bacterium]
MTNTIDKLKQLSAEIYDLRCTMQLLAWDQEVYMPTGAAPDRAYQLSTLSTIIHQKETSKQLGELLTRLEENNESLSVEDRALVRVMKRSYDQSTKLPEAFVTEFTQLTSQSVHAWVEARKKSDFSLFAPYLEKIVAMTKQQAKYLEYVKHPYDALLDLYEEGLTTDDVTKMFDELKRPLVEILAESKDRWNKDFAFDVPFDERDQMAFSELVLKKIGYDFNRGREDKAPHPFTEAMGHNDRRVTNRYKPYDIDFISSALHEGGHGLYEQGIAEKLTRSSLDTGVSLGIHESQSKFWECMVGSRYEFWEDFYPELQKAFPAQLKNVSIDDFYLRMHKVAPSFIRVEADEVTYNLHILIRFEIEKALMEDAVTVSELPELWNAKYKEYLGIDVVNDAQGVLQDIHWSHGSIGYFPTYTMGNLGAAQIWNAYTKYDPKWKVTLRMGNTAKVLAWLTENMYQYGSIYQPRELMKKVSGEELNAKYWVEYIREKYLVQS